MEIKFKAGDRVQVIDLDSNDIARGLCMGDLGTVYDCDCDVVRIQFDTIGRRTMLLEEVAHVPTVVYVRPKADNNIVNNAVRVLAKVYTYVSNVTVKVFKLLRGK